MPSATKHVLKGFLLAVFMFLGVGAALVPRAAIAAPAPSCPVGYQYISIGVQDPNDPTGKTITHCIAKSSTTIQTNPIVSFLRTVLQFFAGGVGIALVGGLTVGGVTYMTARGSAQQVQKAEEIIRNAIIGIALYVFMFAILNFIIPGGILT